MEKPAYRPCWQAFCVGGLRTEYGYKNDEIFYHSNRIDSQKRKI
jgi:hypothetical protein